MGSRRVPSGAWGAGGRAGARGYLEDDGPVWTPSPTSRSYLLNVRPETRSTFCSIIAQLTEETQPLFETTLKSQAVSENSDVRFTCVITGYPEPEVTWYKDDTELDRYCGLPKYEITHQGNRHTLQLYRCQEEDAAIYQASARNTKGIVSCSGVLEVGTMTEYKIHQRWFARLKRKAAAKLREIEQSWKQGKEAAGEADTLRKLSPDRFQRKRRLSGAGGPVPSAPTREAEGRASAAWQERETEPGQHPGLGLMDSFAPGEVTANGDAAPENGEDRGHGLLTYICEAMELGPQRAPQKESGAKKKKKAEEPRPGLQKPELEQAARGHLSENCVPGPDKPDPRGTEGPVDAERIQTWPRDRVPGPSGADSAKEPGSTVGSADQAQKAPALGPGPDREVFFSLKDMYLESTGAARPQGGDGHQAQGGSRAPGATPAGEVPGAAEGERGPAAPGQHMPSAPQPPRLFNRKRFAPPKPKGEPAATNSEPDSSPSRAPEPRAQGSGKAPPQVSAQVPTPPSRRKHGTRDSPLQAGHGTPGEVLESQVAVAPIVLADGSTPRSQGVIEAMDTDPQESRTHADWRQGGRKSTEVDGKMQVDERTRGGGTEAATRTQADRKTQMDTVTQKSQGEEPGRGAQEGALVQGRRMERTQEEGKTQAGEKTQEKRRTQEDQGTQAQGSVPTAAQVPPERRSGSSLSPQPRAPEPSSSEGPGSPQMMECFEQTPEGSSVLGKPSFVLRSEETAVTASGDQEQTLLRPPSGRPMLPSQLLPERSVEQTGGERCWAPEWSGPVKGAPAVSPPQGLAQGRPGEGLGRCPPTGLSPQVPTLPSPGTGLMDSPPQGLPGTPNSQHTGAAAFLPSGDPASLSSAPTLHPGPGTPTQSHPLEPTAAGNEGACAKMPDEEGAPSGPRSCDPGLIDSLKNYLLLLLKLSSTGMSGGGPESGGAPAPRGLEPSPTLAPTVGVAGLSPRTSRRILEHVENDHLVQSAQNLLLSPCTTRRITGLLDREVEAGQQALAAARSRGPSPLNVPTIVVGEEEGPGGGPTSEASRKGEREVPPEGPGLPGTPQERSMGGLPGEAGGQAASGQGPCWEEGCPQEPPGLPAATPEELALGARRKRFLPKVRAGGDGEATKPEERESPTVSPRGPRKGLSPGSPGTPGREKRSPTQGRKAGLLEVPRAEEEQAAGDPGPSPKASGPDAELGVDEGKQEAADDKSRKAKDLLKAPQVIRKIRVEQFPDASGSLKLWCQFFNILSDSVLTWAKDQRPVGEVARSAGDEGPAALAIVQASPVDCGVYRCTIQNEHGSASTDFCLSPEVLSGFISREEGEVGEEIEMTPMVFAKGLADSGCWGDKLFGRLVSEELRGEGHGHGLRKASQAKVIYGLEPIFESGRTCVIKVSSLLVFGPSSETALLGRNYDVTIQGCKIQNMSREYCKIFAAEARAVPGFGEVPEIIPLYLIYRPANAIPYATLEEDLGRPLQPYCSRDWGSATAPAPGRLEAVQKCQAFQHWLYLWTNGSFLVTDLAGVEWKMTDVQIATKLRGYQGLKESCFPALLDQFASSHQCSAFCEMLGLQPLKGPEAAHSQAKAKGSKSPSAGRRGSQLSPQPQKKGLPSPQGTRKSAPSSKATPQASGTVATQLLGQPPAQEGSSKAQGTR
ncbi:alpha-protein kinase 3 isoform X1 [Artibeus jamaicensis]|uniref:alpha-protein kinase 3 isoform X1 n=1 Tax=Artibeus jamaicensis TaxID=9417 RepID=UPI00235A47B5|nr:alpha-protein kinase 3 isoform X1 [Artibeus jamaicensis]